MDRAVSLYEVLHWSVAVFLVAMSVVDVFDSDSSCDRTSSRFLTCETRFWQFKLQ